MVNKYIERLRQVLKSLQQFMNFLKANPRLAFLYLYSSIIPLLGAGVITKLVYTYEGSIEVNSIFFILFTLGTAILMGFAIVPTTVIALVSGYLLGYLGLAPTLIAYTLASLIGYQLVGLIEKGKSHQAFQTLDSTQFIIENIHQHEKSLIVLCRLSPILPFAIMNIFMSSLKINIKNFLLYGSLGMLPRTMIFVFVGSQVKEVLNIVSQGKDFPLVQISFLVLLILSSIGLIAYAKKYILTSVNKTK